VELILLEAYVAPVIVVEASVLDVMVLLELQDHVRTSAELVHIVLVVQVAVAM
jgi:hypothetical protein